MKKDEILVRLRNWCNMITQKYEWLTVKFEYNDKRETYLVSFYPCSKIDTCDQFNIEAMRSARMTGRFFTLNMAGICLPAGWRTIGKPSKIQS